MAVHVRRYRLPLGLKITLAMPLPPYAPGVHMMECEWDPAVPRFKSERARRKVMAAYLAARDEFMQEVAHLGGGNVVVADLDETLSRVETITTIKRPAQN